MAYLGWYRFTYRIGASDIRVESGVIARAARSVPYERIQDVSLEQKLLPRLFGLVEVRFETGAGGKDELKLAYLTEAEGERLREVVRSQKDGAAPVPGADTPAEPVEAPPPLFAMGPRRVVTFGLFRILACGGRGGGRRRAAVRFPAAFRSVGFRRLAGPAGGSGPLARRAGYRPRRSPAG